MLRNLIEINEELCDGCGDCATGCAEGAIQIIDGKAKLVRDDYCDGFGDCVAVCHSGALKVVSREAPEFDENATIENLLATGGDKAVRRYEEAQARHSQNGPGEILGIIEPHGPAAHGGGCPGSAQRVLRHDRPAAAPVPTAASGPVIIPSELQQWPVQLHLVAPRAPFFRDRELVVMNTCGPIASAEVHQRYLRGRSVVVACPKLDVTAPYAQKLGAILAEPSIPKVTVVIMEVPCCRGLSQLVRQGIALSGRADLIAEEHELALTGEVNHVRALV